MGRNSTIKVGSEASRDVERRKEGARAYKIMGTACLMWKYDHRRVERIRTVMSEMHAGEQKEYEPR